MLANVLIWFFSFAISQGLYLLLAWSLSSQEVLAGLIVSALAATSLLAARHLRDIRFAPALGYFRPFLWLPWTTAQELGYLMAGLVRHLTGSQSLAGVWLEVPLDPGGDDARSIARRAIVTYGVTFSPNDYVVLIDRDARRILIRQLIPMGLTGSDKGFLWLE